MLGSRVGIIASQQTFPTGPDLNIIPDLVIWYDSSDVSTLYQDLAMTTPANTDGNPVRVWKNKKTSGINAIAPSDAKRPTLKKVDPTYTINGLPTLLGNGNYMLTNISLSTTALHVFIVYKRNTYTINYGVLSLFADGNADYNNTTGILLTQDYSPYLLTCRNNGFMKQSSLPANGTAFIYEVRIDTAAAISEGYINGVLGTATAYGATVYTGTISTNRLSILNRYNGLYPSNAEVAEIVMFTRVLNTTEKTDVLRYLADKWGITLG